MEFSENTEDSMPLSVRDDVFLEFVKTVVSILSAIGIECTGIIWYNESGNRNYYVKGSVSVNSECALRLPRLYFLVKKSFYLLLTHRFT
mgnify:CR=1 FL=1